MSELRKFHERLGRHATGQTAEQSQFVLLDGWDMKKRRRRERQC